MPALRPADTVGWMVGRTVGCTVGCNAGESEAGAQRARAGGGGCYWRDGSSAFGSEMDWGELMPARARSLAAVIEYLECPGSGELEEKETAHCCPARRVPKKLHQARPLKKNPRSRPCLRERKDCRSYNGWASLVGTFHGEWFHARPRGAPRFPSTTFSGDGMRPNHRRERQHQRTRQDATFKVSSRVRKGVD